MRQALVSIVVSSVVLATASASERYPVKKQYINQTGEIVIVGHVTQNAAIAAVPVRRALPPVQMVPVLQAPIKIQTAQPMFTSDTAARGGLLGATNVNSRDWQSRRKCCNGAQPYINDQANY